MTKLTGSLGVRNEINVEIKGSGPRGKEGKSAYEIWLDLGNEGTEQEYLASLKGDDGYTPIKDVDYFDGADGEQGTRGIQGPKGDTGDVGPRGPIGERGPKGDQGEKGEQGVQGEIGETGPRGEQGEQGPKGDKGEKGMSAYAAAQLGGYSDTEAKFYVDLAAIDGLSDELEALL